MNTYKCFIVVLLIIGVVQVGTTADFNITGAGARAAGMSGAFIGVADDATAVVWNPAGLATLDRPEASIVTRLVTNDTDVDWENSWNEIYDDETKSENHNILNFASVVYPTVIDERPIVFGAAYQQQIDLNLDENTRTTEGGVTTITPAVGLQLSPVISIGAVANICGGTYDLKYKSDGRESSYDFSGFNLGAGLLFNMEELSNPMPVSIGVLARFPYTLKQEGTSNDFEYDMPLMVGIGAAFHIGESLTIATDYEMRKYSDSDDFEFDLNEFRIGAEYLLVNDLGVFPLRAGYKTKPTMETDYKVGALVVGDDVYFLYHPQDDQISGSGFSVGTGYIAERFGIDVAYTLSSYERKYEANTDWKAEYRGNMRTVTFKTTTIILSGVIYF